MYLKNKDTSYKIWSLIKNSNYKLINKEETTTSKGMDIILSVYKYTIRTFFDNIEGTLHIAHNEKDLIYGIGGTEINGKVIYLKTRYEILPKKIGWYEYDLVINPSYRKKGIGTEILNNIIKTVKNIKKEDNVVCLYIVTTEVSKAFYRKALERIKTKERIKVSYGNSIIKILFNGNR